MTSHTSRSLHFRLWAVIGLACLPVFLMAFLDYREQRQAAVVGLKNEVNRMLNAVHMTQETALRSIRQTFDIMARAGERIQKPRAIADRDRRVHRQGAAKQSAVGQCRANVGDVFHRRH